jgi:DNA-binding NarL/FixJ family response regulator
MSTSEVARPDCSTSRRESRTQSNILLSGLTSKEIADRMRISSSTVKASLQLLIIKMGVSRVSLNQEERQNALVSRIRMVATALLLYLTLRPFK